MHMRLDFAATRASTLVTSSQNQSRRFSSHFRPAIDLNINRAGSDVEHAPGKLPFLLLCLR